MKIGWKNNGGQRGTILIITIYAMVVLTGLSVAFMVSGVNESLTTIRSQRRIQAEYAAQAGIERAIYDLRQDCANDINSPSWADNLINGMSLTADSNNYYTVSYASNTINNGSYSVQLKNVAGKTNAIWVKSVGTVGDESETITTYQKLYVMSPWHNAIFGGAGQSSTVINGNFQARGSIHILGTSLVNGDFALELGAGAYAIKNNYQGISNTLSSKVPALDNVSFNSESVTSLNADLWVNEGLVGLLGSGTVGQADVSGNSYKETLDGTFVTDGFGGTQGTANVFSDNGFGQSYRYVDGSFPGLSSAYLTYVSYTSYFEDNALVISNGADLANFSNLKPDSNFTYSSAKGSISMDGAGNLAVSGMIYLKGGNLIMTKNVSDNTINYTGSGTILVDNDVEIDLNLLSSGDNSFPTNILGIMTPATMTFNETGISVMGLFYAEDTIDVVKSVTVMGTLASNYFNFQSAPEINFVPAAANAVPSGMIGRNAQCFVDTVSWQKS